MFLVLLVEGSENISCRSFVLFGEVEEYVSGSLRFFWPRTVFPKLPDHQRTWYFAKCRFLSPTLEIRVQWVWGWMVKKLTSQLFFLPDTKLSFSVFIILGETLIQSALSGQRQSLFRS